MSKLSEKEFLEFLENSLMAESPLEMDISIPEDIFDSTGKLIIVTAFSREFDIALSVDQMMRCQTPRDLYGLL